MRKLLLAVIILVVSARSGFAGTVSDAAKLRALQDSAALQRASGQASSVPFSIAINGRIYNTMLSPETVTGQSLRVEKTRIESGQMRTSLVAPQVMLTSFRGLLDVPTSATGVPSYVALTLSENGSAVSAAGTVMLAASNTVVDFSLVRASSSRATMTVQPRSLNQSTGDTCPFVPGSTDGAAQGGGFSDRGAPAAPSAPGGLLEAELAVEVDYEFFVRYGGVNGATARVQSILNALNPIYESQLGIRFVLTYLHIWDVAADPYSSDNYQARFNQFKYVWNNEFTGTYRDAALFLTGSPLSSSVAGIASARSMCPSYSGGLYGYAMVKQLPSLSQTVLVAAHELGHTLGAEHDPYDSNPQYIMYPGGVSNSLSRFSAASLNQMNAFIDERGACLSTRGRPVPTPTPTPIPSPTASPTPTPAPGANRNPNAVNDMITVQNNSTVEFDPTANDSDPDGDGLRIAMFFAGAHGTLTNSGNRVTFHPTAGYVGSDTFIYEISDGRGGAAQGTVTVNITAAPGASTPTPTPAPAPTPIATPTPVVGNTTQMAQCSDGIDNDGDGRTDYPADPGCSSAQDNYEDDQIGSDGWTVFTPHADTRIIYVSQSTGSDAASGLTTSQAKRSIAAGYALLRDGHPDWLLLKSGDTWTSTAPYILDINKSGLSREFPQRIGSYGTGARPRINVALEKSGFVSRPNWDTEYAQPSLLQHVAITDLNLAGTIAGNGYNYYEAFGLDFSRRFIDVLVENVRIENFGYGIRAYYENRWGLATYQPDDDLRIRRSVFVDNAAAGVQVSTTTNLGVVGRGVFEENLMDLNGAVPSVCMEDISAYVGVNLVRNNIVARGGGGGMSAGANEISGNLLLNNAYGLMAGGAAIHHNVVTGSRQSLRWIERNGVGISASLANSHLYKNIITQLGTESLDPIGMMITPYDGQIAVHENIVYRWNTANNFYRGLALALPVSQAPAPGTYDHLLGMRYQARIYRNDFQQPGQGDLVSFGTRAGRFNASNSVDPTFVSSIVLSNNRYFTGTPATAFEIDNQSPVNFAVWMATGFDSGSTMTQASYPDPERTVARYAGTLGLQASDLAFLQAMRNQSKANWDARITAEAVNAYIRSGFGMQ